MSSAAGIPRKWTVADSAEIYGVKYWGNNYFSINDAGNVQAHPAGPTADASTSRSWSTRSRAAASACRC